MSELTPLPLVRPAGSKQRLKSKPKSRPLVLKIVIGCFVFLLTLAIAGVLFVKLNTSAAADFTDKVLRPLLGSNNVIFIEKVFFNISDKVQQITGAKAEAPQFVDAVSPSATPASLPVVESRHFTLTDIPPNPKFKALAHEGVWKDNPLAAYPGKEVMAHTFVRPDDSRQFTVVTLLKVDMSLIRMGTVAGRSEPAGIIGKHGPGKVPDEIVQAGTLLAAFDGGFQYKDGQYGMIVGDMTYLPLKNDLGTIVGYKDGSLKIINYSGQDLGPNVAFVRQNCPIMIENGEITTSDPKNRALWGRTMTTDIYTWRTGMGLDKDGNLIFAVGNNLVPATLGAALKAAGAVNAIQLDINPNWVRFNIFESIGSGQYKSTTLTRDLKDGSSQYLHGYDKDFFYLYQR